MKDLNDMSRMFKKIIRNGAQTYLMNSTMHINCDNVSPNVYDNYIWEATDTWFLVSYKNYGTIDLWWIICKTNKWVDPIRSPKEGDVIKIIKKTYLEGILNSIKPQENDEWKLGI